MYFAEHTQTHASTLYAGVAEDTDLPPNGTSDKLRNYKLTKTTSETNISTDDNYSHHKSERRVFPTSTLGPLTRHGAKSEPDARAASPGTHEAWLSRQQQRKDLLRENCDKYRHRYPSYQKMLVDEEHKVVLCTIPKAGCTSWKWLLARLQQDPLHHKMYLLDMKNKVKTEMIHRGYLRRYGIKKLKDFSREKISEILDTYTKIITVRDPLVRMLSAYKDKLVPHKDGVCPFCRTLGREITKHYRTDGPFDLKGRTVTELEFLQALVGDKSLVNINGGHWGSYDKLCSPCAIKYDYISHLETVNEDSDNLLKFVFNSTLSLPHYNPSNSSSEYTHILRNIPLDLKEKILEKYKLDMDLFGYKWPGDG